MSISQVFLSASTVDFNYPEIRPSLDLNFARTKTLDPMISFVRNTGGSYVGADRFIKYVGINEPRFQYDPLTGESLGLIIEESRTNLVSYSQDFDNLILTDAVVLQNDGIAPDGTQTADKIIATDTLYPRVHALFIYPLLNKSYSASIFAKAGSVNFLHGTFENESIINIFRFSVNLLTGQSTIIGLNGAITGTIETEKFPNDYWKIKLTFQVPTADNYFLFFGPADAYQSVNASIDSSIYLWGAQFEEGISPTSYIPTFGSTKTRSADVASITGVNFNNFYNQEKGTFLSRVKFIGPPVLSTSNRTTLSVVGNRGFIWQMWEENINRARTVGVKTISRFNLNQAVSDLSLTGNIITSGSTQTLITTYSENDCTLVQNGEVVSKDITVKKFTDMDQLVIGDLNGGHYLNGVISQITYWPRNLPDSQLQSLSS